MTLQRVGFIGGGQLGRAMGQVMHEHGDVQVAYYDKDPTRSSVPDLKTLIGMSDALFLAVPSWAHRQLLRDLKKHAPPERRMPLVSMAKGVLSDFVTIDELLCSELHEHYAVCVLYGPMIADEIATHKGAAGVLGVGDETVREPLEQLLDVAGIANEYTSDLRSPALCAVFKNIYALAFGMAAGLQLGANARGRLLVGAMFEMRKLVHELGGKASFTDGLAGLGDLMATGFSDQSFNFRVGKSIAEGIADESIKSEGIVALKALGKRVELEQYPILHILHRTLFDYQTCNDLRTLVTSP